MTHVRLRGLNLLCCPFGLFWIRFCFVALVVCQVDSIHVCCGAVFTSFSLATVSQPCSQHLVPVLTKTSYSYPFALRHQALTFGSSSTYFLGSKLQTLQNMRTGLIHLFCNFSSGVGQPSNKPSADWSGVCGDTQSLVTVVRPQHQGNRTSLFDLFRYTMVATLCLLRSMMGWHPP